MKNTTTMMKITSILVLFLSYFAECDITEDRNRCGEPLIAVATCLPFVSGEAKVPTMDCCTGFKQVLQKNPECICILIKDRDDPSLGLNINVTLALSLPQRCRITTKLTAADCPTILHLPPNSPDAQVFQQFGSTNTGSTHQSAVSPSPSPTALSAATGLVTSVPTTEAHASSDGGRRGKTALWLETASLGTAAIVVVARILA